MRELYNKFLFFTTVGNNVYSDVEADAAIDAASDTGLDEASIIWYSGSMNEHASDTAEPPSPESDPYSRSGVALRRRIDSSKNSLEASHVR